MAFVFGPVPSRRLGRSLGIDPVPLKTCTWSCVYCQLGRTTRLTVERKEYVSVGEILEEARRVVEEKGKESMDWVTILGSGEPTLNSGMGRLVRGLKEVSSKPLAVITNGSLLFLPEVRADLLEADAVLPSLDAGDAELHKKIHRHHRECTYERHIQGLQAFRKEYEGKLWVEVMLMEGINDSREALEKLAGVMARVGPDQVHLLVPDRPPSEEWVRPAPKERVDLAKEVLGGVARVLSLYDPANFDLSGGKSLVEAILDVIRRHPMKEEEVLDALERYAPGRVQEVLGELERSGGARLVTRLDERFWVSSETRFPD